MSCRYPFNAPIVPNHFNRKYPGAVNKPNAHIAIFDIIKKQQFYRFCPKGFAMNYRQTAHKIISLLLCVIIFFSTSISTGAKEIPIYTVSQTNKDTAADFDNFLQRCSLQERIALLQSLRGIDVEIRDECFGKLDGLPSLEHFTEDKDKANQNLPLKPKTYNEVLPTVVSDALAKGHLSENLFSPENIKRELVWRRYNKVTFLMRNTKSVDYHKDIVMWVAEKNDIENYNFLSTYEMEKQIAFKFFEKIWDKLTPQQREELLCKIEKETGTTFENKANIATLPSSEITTYLLSTNVLLDIYFCLGISILILEAAALLSTTTTICVSALIASAPLGPLAWCLAGLGGVGGGIICAARSETDHVACFVITVNSIKAKWE